MSEKMELILLNPEENGFLQHIDWNKEEIEEAVRKIADEYKGVVYTEDTMPDAKKDRAELRKFIEVIETRRKLVKKKCMEPYDTFEKELKEITALIKEQIDSIDEQVKEYEIRVKKEKKARLQGVYDKAIGEFKGILPFEKVFEEQYLNVSFKENKAASEIKEKIEKVKSDLAAIDSLDSKYQLNVKDVYLRTLDMSKAMAENTRLIQLEEKIEADRRKKDEEEARRKAAAEEKAKEVEERRREEARLEERQAALMKVAVESVIENPENVSESSKNVPIAEESAEKTEEDLVAPLAGNVAVTDPFTVQENTKKYKASFTVIGTKAQISALKQYMITNGIEFGKVGR